MRKMKYVILQLALCFTLFANAQNVGLDPNFPVADGPVTAMALDSARHLLYVGGGFSTIGGKLRSNVAAIDLAADTVTSWTVPLPDNISANSTQWQVSALTISDSAVFFALTQGDIITFNTSSELVAAKRWSSDTLNWPQRPYPLRWNSFNYAMQTDNAVVYALKVAGNQLIVGGFFDQMGDSLRSNLVAYDMHTLKLTNWKPNPDAGVVTLETDSSRIYAGGAFTNINGVTRYGFAAFSSSNDSLLPIGNNLISSMYNNGLVSLIRKVGQTLYIADNTIYLATYTLGDTALTGPRYNAPFNNLVWDMAVNNGNLYPVGMFDTSTAGTYAYNHICRLDTTLQPACWYPNAKDRVYCVASWGNYIYAGGYFHAIDGQNLGYVAAMAVNQITGPAVSSGSFCSGGTVNVKFNAEGGYNNGNVFTVQLSDSLGNFANPYTIGTQSSASSGNLTVSCTLPVLHSGPRYALRILSSNPPVAGCPAGSYKMIDTLSVSGEQISVYNTYSTSNVPSPQLCSGISYGFSPAGYLPGVSAYNWSVSPGWAIDSGQGTSSIYVTPDTSAGTLSLILSNVCGNSSAISGTFNHIVSSIPQLGPITGPSSMCVNAAYNFYVDSVPEVERYEWWTASLWTIYTNNGDTMVRFSGIQNYTGVGIDTLTVTPYNECGTGTPTAIAVRMCYPFTSALPAIQGPYITTDKHYSICHGDTVVFGLPNNINVDRYVWNITNGWNIAAGAGTDSVWVVAGSDSATLSVFAINGCDSTVITSCVIISNTAPPFAEAITGDTAPCFVSIVDYNIAPQTGDYLFNWTYPGGWSSNGSWGPGSAILFVNTASGYLNVQVTNGCGSTTGSQYIHVLRTPLVNEAISGDTVVCKGCAYNYQAIVDTNATSYFWTIPSGWTLNSGQGTDQVSVTALTDTGFIYVQARNACYYGHVDSVLIVSGKVAPPPPLGINGPATVCANSTVTYNAVANQGAIDYVWTVPAGWSISGNPNQDTITVLTGATGGTLGVSARNYCDSSAAVTFNAGITVDPSSLSAITGPDTVCSGAVQTYSIVPVAGTISYNWIFPSGWTVNGNSDTNSIAVIPSLNSGTVSVMAMVQGCNDTVNLSQTLPVMVKLPIQSSAISGNLHLCAGANVAYNINSMPNAVSYYWSVPAGWSITSANGDTIIQVTAGTASGQLSVVATDACGATALSVVNISVDSTQAITVNGADTTVCGGDTIVFSASGAAFYQWRNSIQSGNVSNSVYPFAAAANAVVYLSASSVYGCVAVNDSFMVNTLPEPVWPGDANEDLIVNNYDILTLGLVYGATGPLRPGASISWMKQCAPAWSDTLNNGENGAFADCNGDGIINDADTLAVSANYQLTHVRSTEGGTPGSAQISISCNRSSYNSGDTVKGHILLGSSTDTLTDAYGIALTFNGGQLVKPGTLQLTQGPDWLTAGSHAILFSRLIDSNTVDLAQTRTNHQGLTGFGPIADFSFIANNISADSLNAQITVGAVLLYNHAGDTIGTTETPFAYTVLKATSGISSIEMPVVNIYPNPAGSTVWISVGTNNLAALQVMLTDIAGRVVLRQKAENNLMQLNLQQLSAGSYLVLVENDGTVLARKKLVIEH